MSDPLYSTPGMTLAEFRDYIYRYNVQHGDAYHPENTNHTTPAPFADKDLPNTIAGKLEMAQALLSLPKADLKPAVPGPFSAKAPMHSLPLEKLESLARVLEYGNRKYAKDNWVGTANDPDRYIGAILRHLAAIRAGVMIDESGLPHVGHLAASVLILEEALRNAGLLTTDYSGA